MCFCQECIIRQVQKWDQRSVWKIAMMILIQELENCNCHSKAGLQSGFLNKFRTQTCTSVYLLSMAIFNLKLELSSDDGNGMVHSVPTWRVIVVDKSGLDPECHFLVIYTCCFSSRFLSNLSFFQQQQMPPCPCIWFSSLRKMEGCISLPLTDGQAL